MSTAKDLKTQLQEDLDELKQVREEIQLKLHLASMDAKSYWKELEPKLGELEHKLVHDSGHMALDAASKLSQDLKDAFQRFRKRLG